MSILRYHFPKLQVGAVEHEVSWAAHFLDRMDYNYDQRARGITGYRFKEIMERILADCGEEEKAKIAEGNTARVYQL